MALRFCSICKTHVELPADRMAADAAFYGSGHDDTKRSHFARDIGRQQRAPRTTKQRTKERR